MGVKPVGRIAKVDWGLTLARPLEPSEGDMLGLEAIGYPTVAAVVEAARRSGRTGRRVLLPKSLQYASQ